MKKTRVLALFLVCVFAFFTLAGCSGDTGGTSNETPGGSSGGDPSDATYTLKISHSVSQTDFMHLGWVSFKEQIEEKSDGRIKVEIYDSSSLTVDRTLVEMMGKDLVQLGSAPTHLIGTMINDPRWSFNMIPFYYDGKDENLYKATSGDAFELIKPAVEEKLNVRPIDTYMIGWVGLGSSVKPMTKLDDVKGQKIGCGESPVYMNLVNSFGANATPLAFSEVFTALQQGTLDGYITAPNLYNTMRFYEYAENFTDLGAIGSVHCVIISPEFYDSLPQDLQAVLDETLADTVQKLRADSAQAGEDALKAMEEAGCTITRMTPELLEECRAASAADIESKKQELGEEFMKLLDADLSK